MNFNKLKAIKLCRSINSHQKFQQIKINKKNDKQEVAVKEHDM